MKTLPGMANTAYGYRLDTEQQSYIADPHEQAKLHSQFASAINIIAEEHDWSAVLSKTGNSSRAVALPSIAVIPPQSNEPVIFGYQIDAGIPDRIPLEDWSGKSVKRSIGFNLLRYRHGLDILDVMMPNLISAEHIVTFRNMEPIPCDPERWAKISMRFAQELWARQETETRK